jgi:hypothetical protein
MMSSPDVKISACVEIEAAAINSTSRSAYSDLKLFRRLARTIRRHVIAP